MRPRKGDVEWLFAFARRVSALDDALMPDVAKVLDALADVSVEPSERFEEPDASLSILLQAMAGMAEARANSSERSRGLQPSSAAPSHR